MSNEEMMKHEPIDWDAARKLVEEDELLKDDELTLSVLDKRGVVGEGADAITDIGTFLDARKSALEAKRDASLAGGNVEDNMVIHSEREDNNK